LLKRGGSSSFQARHPVSSPRSISFPATIAAPAPTRSQVVRRELLLRFKCTVLEFAKKSGKRGAAAHIGIRTRKTNDKLRCCPLPAKCQALPAAYDGTDLCALTVTALGCPFHNATRTVPRLERAAVSVQRAAGSSVVFLLPTRPEMCQVTSPRAFSTK
jgi:hypothetical protein